jgi:hypothetical protein
MEGEGGKEGKDKEKIRFNDLFFNNFISVCVYIAVF